VHFPPFSGNVSLFFLEHQRQMQAQRGRDNAQNLFEVEQIPSDNQIRNILDEIAASILFPIFDWVYHTKSDFQNLLIILSRSTTNSICFKKNKEGMRTGFGISHYKQEDI
jgi:hypothetical protein